MPVNSSKSENPYEQFYRKLIEDVDLKRGSA